MDAFSILGWLGFYTDNAFPQVGGFWSTPVGLFISGTMVTCYLFVLFNKKIKETFFETIWYVCAAMTMGCAFIGGWKDCYNPHNIVKTFLFLMMIKSVYIVWFKWKESNKCV